MIAGSGRVERSALMRVLPVCELPAVPGTDHDTWRSFFPGEVPEPFRDAGIIGGGQAERPGRVRLLNSGPVVPPPVASSCKRPG